MERLPVGQTQRNGGKEVKRPFVTMAILVVLASLLVAAGCSQTAPATPTPAAPKAAAEATKAPAPAPTTAPTAPKVAFPEKGKAISILIPWPTGGGNDLTARVLASGMEKDLGVPVNVVNKPGAGSQTGLAEGALAKPDGYTLVNTALPNTIGIYLEPERKATFNRKSFIPVALHTIDPITISVNAKSQFKTIKDVIDYAKANPGKLKAGTGGLAGVQHLSILLLQKLAGVKFAIVHFDGGAQQITNLLGEHIDVVFEFPPVVIPQVKNGTVRALAVMDNEPYPFLPEVPTMESQGYNTYVATSRVYSVPAGTPPEIVNALTSSIKRVMDMPDHKQKITEMNAVLRYMDPPSLEKYWAEMEETIAPLVPMTKEQ